MGTDSSTAVYWAALVDALRDFLDDRVGITQGCRNIVDIARAMGEWPDNDLFLPFVAFDSDTDTRPVGPVRARWAPAALQREDAERTEFENLCRAELKKAAQELLEYAGKHAL
jgi:hypothetical protein